MTKTIRMRAIALAGTVAATLAGAWRERRTEDGGLSDEVAMIAVLFVVASAVGFALLGVLTGAVSDLDFGI
jgi:hypothetical protein